MQMTTNCGRMNICLVPIVFFSVLNYNVVIGSPKPDNDVHFHINMADTKSTPDQNQERHVEHGKDYSSDTKSTPDQNQERDVEHGKDYSSGQDCLMKNTALYGHNIWPQWFKEKETIGDCQMACMYRKIECKFWSYNKQDKRCAIKTSKGNAREGNNDQWESGAKDCVPSKDCLMKNTHLYGNNIWTPEESKKKETILDCQMACMNKKECKFWSYRKYDKKCAIKTSKGNANEGNDDLWESGSRDCVPKKSKKSSGPEPTPEPTEIEIQVATRTTPKPTLGIMQISVDD